LVRLGQFTGGVRMMRGGDVDGWCAGGSLVLFPVPFPLLFPLPFPLFSALSFVQSMCRGGRV
jgi:hypothetical protein